MGPPTSGVRMRKCVALGLPDDRVVVQTLCRGLTTSAHPLQLQLRNPLVPKRHAIAPRLVPIRLHALADVPRIPTSTWCVSSRHQIDVPGLPGLRSDLSDFLGLKPRPGDGPPPHFRQPPLQLPSCPVVSVRVTCSYMDKPRSRRAGGRAARARSADPGPGAITWDTVENRSWNAWRGAGAGAGGGLRVCQNPPQGAVGKGLLGSCGRCSLPNSVTYPEASTDA
jgi:hypothetical protein